MKFTTQPTNVEWPAMKLMGISCRTSNAAEIKEATAKIGPTVQQYRTLATMFDIGKQANKVYHVYTAYESDFHGPYTFFIGQEIPDTGNVPANLQALTIPAQQYVQFTAGPGNILEVCIGMWQEIWKMETAELGGERTYIADIEVYDERAIDPTYAILDILIGIK